MLFFAFFFLNGCETNNQIVYPEGGYNYPKNVTANDTNFYFYALKNIEPKKDSFQDAHGYLFYRPFNEPNLSIRPLPKETFRLTYSEALGGATVITFNDSIMTVKEGDPQVLYDDDTTRFTEIEKYHFRLLRRRFPIDTTGKESWLKKYLDSITKIYPQLLDPNYYAMLYQKSFKRNEIKFDYKMKTIRLSKAKFNSLVQQINSSGFWNYSYSLDCEDYANDGSSIILEANTKNKYQIVCLSQCYFRYKTFSIACQNIVDEANLISSRISIAGENWKMDTIK